MEYYSEADLTKRILTHPAIDSQDKLELAHHGWRNPYTDAYIWLKSELLDIKGIAGALTGRENVMKLQVSTDSKKRSD